MSTNDVLLEIKNLEVTYDTEEGIMRAVNGISFQVKRGKTLGIVGETGAGKTTAALSILRLLPERTGNIRSGSIEFDGVDILTLPNEEMRRIRGEKISMIFQDPMSSLNPILPIGKQIAEVLELHDNETKNIKHRLLSGARKKKFKGNHTEIDRRVDEILELVGISASRKNEYPHQFSGGMKQRVVIAMALVCEPSLVIADEPTTALDVTIQAQVLEIMDGLKEKLDTAMILITHDLGIVAQICDEVAIMYAGEIIEHGTVEDIFDEEKAHHPYTTGLFKSIPRLDDIATRLQPVKGLMPDPSDLPTGCKFHPRCELCEDICVTEAPMLAIYGTHSVKCPQIYRGVVG